MGQCSLQSDKRFGGVPGSGSVLTEDSEAEEDVEIGGDSSKGHDAPAVLLPGKRCNNQ
jgi:hypothetical protein